MAILVRKFAGTPEGGYQSGRPDIGGALVRPSSIIFGENLTFWLQRRKLKQIELARKLSVSPTAVSRWADGRALPTCETLDKISLALEIPVSALFRDVTDPRSVDQSISTEDALQMIVDKAITALGKKARDS